MSSLIFKKMLSKMMVRRAPPFECYDANCIKLRSGIGTEMVLLSHADCPNEVAYACPSCGKTIHLDQITQTLTRLKG